MAPRSARRARGAEERRVEIASEAIDLGDLLKLARVVASGGEAKRRIQSGDVRVNGQPERRRGRRIVPGDRVAMGADHLVVASRAGGRPHEE